MDRARITALLIVCASVSVSLSALAPQKPDPAVLQRYFQQGHEALAQGRFADAEKLFGKLVQLDPSAAVPYANLGLVYFEEKKFTKAVPAFQQALKLDSDLSNARFFLAMSLSGLGRYGEALPGLETGFKQEHDPKLKRLLGLQLEKTYTGLRRDREAVEVALELTNLYPNDPEVLYQTGRLCGNFAYLSIQKLGEVAPHSVWRHLASGDYYETQGDFALAEREYRRVLDLDPNRPGIHYRLGRALVRSHDSGAQAEALKQFEQELALDPTNASAAYEAAEMYRKLGQLGKAHRLLSAALKYEPEFEQAQAGLGQVLILEGKAGMALPHLRKAIALDPSDPTSYYQLALGYRALGERSEEQRALAQFRRVSSVKARHDDALAGGLPQ